MLFDGLLRQSEINHLLDEIFGDYEGASLDEAEGVVRTLYEEGNGRTPITPRCLLSETAFAPPHDRSATRVLVGPGASFASRESIAWVRSFY